MRRLRLDYNSPFILTFCLLAMAALVASTLTGGWFGQNVVSIPGEVSWQDWTVYPRLILHVLGHASMKHLFMNVTFLLLVGPLLEELYGAKLLIILTLVTAILTGLIFIFFFDGLLLGASGVVFAMIILSSFANAKSGTIPLTFVLVALLFLGNELLNIYGGEEVHIARFAHIVGGILGGAFGFYLAKHSESPWK